MVISEDIRSMNWVNIPSILGRISLYNLYNYYKEVLDLSTKTVKSVYLDRVITTLRELEE